MSTGRFTILVVDDSLTVRVGLERTLVHEGFHVQLAASNTEAETRLAGAAFALVILDVHLGDGSSLPLLRRLTSGHYGRRIRSLVISGSEGIAARLDALSNGDDFVAKPYDSSFIADRVRSLCGLPQLEQRTACRAHRRSWKQPRTSR
jgi:DNA-binding response OmpR family regulator